MRRAEALAVIEESSRTKAKGGAMSEKCKTCASWKYVGYSQGYGSCGVLPGLIEFAADALLVGEDFGCSGHTPKVAVPEILTVMVQRVELTGGVVFADYAACSPEVQQAAVEFLTKPRDEQDGG